MAWRCPGDKPFSEPMMVSLLMHIYATRLQWVKSFPPGATYMRQWIRSALVQITACHIFGTKPLPKTKCLSIGPFTWYLNINWSFYLNLIVVASYKINYTCIHVKMVRKVVIYDDMEILCLCQANQWSVPSQCLFQVKELHQAFDACHIRIYSWNWNVDKDVSQILWIVSCIHSYFTMPYGVANHG